MTNSPLHSVSVAGVTFDELGRVLIIKRRDNGQWQAPGGVLELEETFEDGVVREVLEETGVSVEVGSLTGVYKNLKKGVVALVYRCRVIGGEPVPSDESLEVGWYTVDRATALMTPAFAIRVHDAAAQKGRDQDQPAASRVHDGVDVL